MALSATPAQQADLLEVQRLDSTLQQLQRRRDSLPEAARAREIEVELGALETRLVAARTEVADRTLDLRKAENDVEQVVNRAKRDQERLDSGTAGAKDLESLQHELVSLAKRQAELEDDELEAMQRVEDAAAALEQLEAQRTETLAEQAALAQELARLLAEIEVSRNEATLARIPLAAGIPADVLSLYDKVRADHGGIGAALLQAGTCQGCHISLDASQLESVRNAAADAVVRCDQCRSILVRTPESGL